MHSRGIWTFGAWLTTVAKDTCIYSTGSEIFPRTNGRHPKSLHRHQSPIAAGSPIARLGIGEQNLDSSPCSKYVSLYQAGNFSTETGPPLRNLKYNAMIPRISPKNVNFCKRPKPTLPMAGVGGRTTCSGCLGLLASVTSRLSPSTAGSTVPSISCGSISNSEMYEEHGKARR